MKGSIGALLIFIAIIVIGLALSMYTVDQKETAIVLQLGQPKGGTKDPGLHFKIPLVQEVRYFDNRILSVDPEPKQMVVSGSLRGVVADANPEEPNARGLANITGEPIIVDVFARYKITEPLQFLKRLRTIREAEITIERIMNDATRNILGKTTLKDLLSSERTQVMDTIRKRVNSKIIAEKMGIEIVDIRIVRADLTPELRQSTVKRMVSELLERATETRARGKERATEIRATADKERSILIAEAQRDSQILRGEGDNNAIETYANAFNKDKDFYEFIRSMEAYTNTLANPETQLILSPDNKFLHYLKSSE